jgi:hypothetical protein
MSLSLPKNSEIQKEIFKEAEFYNLEGLKELISPNLEINILKAYLDTTILNTAQIKEFERAMAFAEVSEGLTDTQVAKLQSLSEAVEFESVDTFKSKIATLRESYFPTKGKASPLSESVAFDEEPVGDLEEVAEKQVPVEMAAYMNAITRGIKK